MIEDEKYLKFVKLNDYKEIIHLFTKKPFNFNKRIVSEIDINNNYEKIEKDINYKFLAIKKPIQTHTNVVKIVTKDNVNETFEDVDGLITDISGIALVTSLADCQGILLYDPKKRIIGNIHSGWKGTLNKIIEKAINLMVDKFKSNPQDIIACICPSILKCCFEVDEEVVNMFKNNFTDINQFFIKGDIKEGKQKYYIDTIGINIEVMKNLGLLAKNISVANICTKCNSNIYHSYRTDREKSGRNIALICLK